MPFPQTEVVRKAVEKAIREGLAAGDGDWIAQGKDDNEWEFRPKEDGTIEIELCLDDDEIETTTEDQPVEKTLRFRVCVEFVAEDVA